MDRRKIMKKVLPLIRFFSPSFLFLFALFAAAGAGGGGCCCDGADVSTAADGGGSAYYCVIPRAMVRPMSPSMTAFRPFRVPYRDLGGGNNRWPTQPQRLVKVIVGLIH